MLACGCALHAANAGSSGEVRGTVSNVATGAFLEGAQVSLQPGDYSTLSARDGTFVIPRVPAGDYTLSVSYTGLDAKEVPVRVIAGSIATQQVGLTAAIYTLSTFVVEGEREGNALPITQQRNALNVKNTG